jgi:membrane protease YdiL (CAAX protease family)
MAHEVPHAPEQAGEDSVGAQTAPPQQDRLAETLRGFGPLGILAILVIFAGNLIFVPLSAILVLVWARLSHTPWREIGYARPKSWIAVVLGGVVFGAVFKLLMKSIVMPLLGADPLNQAFQFLVGNPAALPGMLYIIIFGAGFNEETMFRGYMFERLGKLLGTSTRAKMAIVLFTSAWFAAEHYPLQGLAGVEQALITGLVFGSIYAVTKRIWFVMVAHVAFDLMAVAIIYFGLEESVAHLIFR